MRPGPNIVDGVRPAGATLLPMPTGNRPTPPILSDGVITLRPLRPDDCDDIAGACQDPQIQQWTTVPSPYALADAVSFVEARSSTANAWWATPTWAITPPMSDRWSGSVDLRPDGSGAAEVGYMVAPWARGAGYATRALRLACGWSFGALALDVIVWYAYVGNEASRRTARAAGFRIPDAVLRRHLVQRGERRDCWAGDLVPEDVAAAARREELQYLGPALTIRELDVLGRLAHGESNREMALALGISENTVKNHVRSILEKLQAKSRTEAVVVGLSHGLTTLPS